MDAITEVFEIQFFYNDSFFIYMYFSKSKTLTWNGVAFLIVVEFKFNLQF